MRACPKWRPVAPGSRCKIPHANPIVLDLDRQSELAVLGGAGSLSANFDSTRPLQISKSARGI